MKSVNHSTVIGWDTQDKTTIGEKVTEESANFWSIDEFGEDEKSPVCVITQQSSGSGCSVCEGSDE